jgi:pimeloyl-ACP methyl ester carboxylesterase
MEKVVEGVRSGFEPKMVVDGMMTTMMKGWVSVLRVFDTSRLFRVVEVDRRGHGLAYIYIYTLDWGTP